jgi:hypothetical protein
MASVALGFTAPIISNIGVGKKAGSAPCFAMAIHYVLDAAKS